MPHRILATTADPSATTALLAVGGAMTWGYSTIVKVVGAPAMVGAGSVATAAEAGLSLADMGQMAGGLISLASILVAGYNAIRGRLARGDNRRRLEAGVAANKLRIDAGIAEAKVRTEAGHAEIKLFLERGLAELRLEQERKHAVLTDHLSQQDATLAVVRQAVTAPAPAIAIVPQPAQPAD